MVEEEKVDMRFIEWREKFKKKISDFFYRLTHTYDLAFEETGQQNKLVLLYEEMMKDIEASDAPGNIKEGLDALPVMIGYLLAGAGGGAVAMIIGSLLAPYIQAKLTYPMNRQAQPFRLDPGTITRLWLRGFPDEVRKEEWWDDLKDLGWDEDRIAAAKELAYLLPTPSDLITWQAREVFEPEMIEKYGLLDEVDLLKRDLFYKVGMSDEMIDNYWKAHWVHPELRTIVEMLRRTDFSAQDMKDWFRLVEIPPFWRQKLIDISYEVPTRVDVRRWWDMRTIDEARLREIYTWQGYHGRDLDDYVLWTKVYTAFPDLVARYKYGWIREDEVKSELVTMGMSPERIEEMWQTKFKKPAQTERVAVERDLTMTDIIMGIKKEIVSREDGIAMIEELGYDHFEATFKVDARVAAAGSPETPLEFRRLVEDYKKAVGQEYKEIPQEVIEAEKALLRITQRLKEAVEKDTPPEELDELQADVAIAKATYEDLYRLAKL